MEDGRRHEGVGGARWPAGARGGHSGRARGREQFGGRAEEDEAVISGLLGIGLLYVAWDTVKDAHSLARILGHI